MPSSTDMEALVALVRKLADGTGRADAADPTDKTMVAWAQGFNEHVERVAEQARRVLASVEV